MANDNDIALKFNRPGIFRSAFVRHSLDQGAPLIRQSISSFNDTNVLSTASFRYDPPGVGLKSTQQLNVDYSNFASHTFFNSAEVNVNVAFENIFNKYPFDGTRREVEAFKDSLTGFESWIFDQFPKNIGYLNFSGSTGPASGSYIRVIDHAGSQFPTISKLQTGHSKLDPGLDPITFEFHVYVPAQANENQVILQKLSSSVHGFTVGLIGTASTSQVDAMMTFVSASAAIAVSGTINKGEFTHIVGTYDRRGDVNKLLLYVNERFIASSSTKLEMGQIDFTLSPMHIGSGSSAVTASAGGLFVPVQTFSGSLDELRIFHDVRSIRQQKKYAKKGIFAQPELKLYYKFNEPSGTIGSSPTDQINRIILDHSGNSLFSYIDESTFSFNLRITSSIPNPMVYEEMQHNPVLFSTFAPIIEFNQTLLVTASDYDSANPNLITKLIPQHMLLEGQAYEALQNITGTIADQIDGTGMPGEAELGQPQLLAALLYVIAREFDQVKQFIDAFGDSLFVDYGEYNTTPDQLLTFLASYRGVDLPGLFNNATFEQFINAQDITDEFGTHSTSLQQVQNEIWRRTLTNLNEIIRSKGTVHSIKSFIRTLGIDPDQHFRIREFGGPKSGRIGESRENKSTVSTMLDMTGSYTSFMTSSILRAATRTEPGYPWVSGISSHDILLTSGSWSVEAVYQYPRARSSVTSQSLMRLVTSGSTLSGTANNTLGTSPSGTFVTPFNLIATSGTYLVSSSLTLFGKPVSGSTGNSINMAFTGVNIMDGNQWHVSFGRNRNDDPNIDNASPHSSYFLRAYRQSYGEIVEQFVTSTYVNESIDSSHAYDAQQVEPMVLWIGSGALEQAGGYLSGSNKLVTAFDGKVGHIRFWSKGLLENESREHARNFRSLGVTSPSTNFNFVTDLSGSFEKLRLDVSTDQEVTQSDSTGAIILRDFSQGLFSGTHKHMIYGAGFNATSSIILPETFNYSILSPKFDEATTTNKVRVRSFSEYSNVQRFGGALTPVFETPPTEEVEDDPRFAIDFSIADSLNEDIVNIFATFDELDDALGSPTMMFSPDYPDLQKLRDVYFNRLTDRVNFKAFFEFFRWFDTSIGMFIEQLIPRKTRFLGVNFVIESHMLERPKFMYQFEDAYLGETLRSANRGTVLLQLLTGMVKRY